jgi:Family of unknown function (DUF6445)
LPHEAKAMPGPLKPATDLTPRVEHIGRERQPLLILDHCLANPDAVLAIAARASFARHGPHYPGIRASVPRVATDALIAPLADLLVSTFALPGLPGYDECFLSLVTTAPEDLQPIQRLPHFDGLEPDRLALLLYLDRAERGGTAFYRQRATGFETVTAERFTEFRDVLERGAAQQGLPASDYIRGDTALYQQAGKIAGRFNRAVVYRGNSLHCADLAADFEPHADPLAGRLTLNLFLRSTG